MSIFKDTLKPEVIAQLRARQSVISQEDRDGSNNPNGTFVGYQTKNAWVRMTSLVNYDSGKDIVINEGNFVDVAKDGAYTGDQLSRKYVLFGGTPYYNPSTNKSFLRKGVDKADAIYGSNLDYTTYSSTNNSSGQYDRPFGARPMPGISSVQINSKSAYGSLREAIVKFYCWDRHQLEELEILFMRPGYSVILEWGWSKYIDYTDAISKSIENIPNPKTINAKAFTVTNFTTPTINTYDKNLTVDTVYSEIDRITKQTKSNYDALLGYVKNFNWTLLDNGGFECTTTLIALGEVISSLKISSNTSKMGDEDNIFADPDQPKPYQYTDYEKILLTLKAESDPADFISGSYTDVDLNNIQVTKVKTEFQQKMINRGHGALYDKYFPPFRPPSLPNLTQPYLKKNYDTNRTNGEPINEYNEYISFDVWIALMDSYFLLNDSENNTKYLYFKIPNAFDYCLAAPDSISVDPSVCYVDNVDAFPEVNYIYDRPYTLNGNKGVLSKLTYKNKTVNVPLDNFYDKTKRIGVLKNIYINIDYLLSSFKNMNSSTNDDGVNILDYVQNVLNGISTALGGLNNFKVFTKNNRIVIGDAYYVEDPSEAKLNKKFKFDLLGLKSICRDVNITSRIFQEQSTMIAIAAQAKANIGDIYSSSQTIFNAGLTDRLVVAKNIPGSNNSSTTGTPGSIESGNDDLYNKLLLLATFIKKYIIGDPLPPTPSLDLYQITKSPNPAASVATLRSILLQFNPEINFKALIPFELEITLDGIGGLVIGQIFTVNKDILPKDYYNKNLGFIITGISHDLSKNDWVTKIKTQICLLDDDIDTRGNRINQLSKALNEARIKKVKQLVSKYLKKSLNYVILRDYMYYLANRSLASYLFADMPDDEAIGSNVYSDFNYSSTFSDPQKTYRYSSFLSFDNAVKNKSTLDYFDNPNNNVGDFINKYSYGYNTARSINQKFYPAKNSEFTTTTTTTIVVKVPDNYGFTQFAKDWINTAINTTPVAIKNETLASTEPTTYGQLLDKYKQEISVYETNNYSDSSTFEAFDPSLYVPIRKEIADKTTDTPLTPNSEIWSNTIQTKAGSITYIPPNRTARPITINFNYQSLSPNILYDNIEIYLNKITTTSPDLIVLDGIYKNTLNTSIVNSIGNLKKQSSFPVYEGYDFKVGFGATGLLANVPLISLSSDFISYYQLTGEITTTGAASRKPYTNRRVN